MNAPQPDIVAITGDIVERKHCLDWIPDTLGRLRAPAACTTCSAITTRRSTSSRLQSALADAGLIHVGGTCQQVTVRDAPLILAGNELPWFSPAADMTNCPPHDANGLPLRVLLAHSPDQFDWAQAQRRRPDARRPQPRRPGSPAARWARSLSPSIHGVRYAAGDCSRAATRCSTSAAAPPASRRSAGTARRKSRCWC